MLGGVAPVAFYTDRSGATAACATPQSAGMGVGAGGALIVAGTLLITPKGIGHG